jgi:ferric-dicitrate binding protein FerR (iron transport regulator)
MQDQKLDILFQRYIHKTATEAEKQEFFEFIRSQDSDQLLQELAERYPVTENLLVELPEESSRQIVAAILHSENAIASPVHRVHFIRRFRWAAAAVFFGIMALAGWWVMRGHSIDQQNTVAYIDIKAPATNRATITLANGKTIYLDSAGNGKLASVGTHIQLVKLGDGQIAYSGTTGKVEYNTITNPRGSKVIDMVFVDGSHVWLNAGSSVTYPVPFEGNERKVKINGEAYFEIAHNAAKPFKVVKGDMEVAVLGTHFNVNAFDDEAAIKVTLLEGSVKINRGGNTGLLKPGQQAQITEANAININSNADLEAVMAWKNGWFSFKGTDIKTMMRSIARWYDVEVDYTKDMKGDETITGDIDRKANISEVMKTLQYADIHFSIEGRKVIVKP